MDDGEFTVDAIHAFRDDGGDPLELTAVSDDASVATVRIQGTDLVITPVTAGIANMTLTADDQKGGTASQMFTVTVTNTTPANAAITDPGHNWFTELEVTFDEPLDDETTAIINMNDLIENARVDFYYPVNDTTDTIEVKSIRWDLSNRNRPILHLETEQRALGQGYFELEMTFVPNQVKDLSGDVTSKATGVVH
ncbi:Ig domain-containing protein [Brevibacillus centrosporus]|uniref:Ig domain-containing protein n=1 Tax=Brevibacillus centrosporus TaxID=54910 RepID=UPI0039877CA8